MTAAIRQCSKTDFDLILNEFREFWDHDRTLPLHHPIFINEFADTAYVIEEGGQVIAYMFGFISQTEPTGYVQLLAVRGGYHKQGLARQLYAHFERQAGARGCTRLKAITSPVNSLSIAFHRAIGMRLLGTPNAEGVPVVKDYAGPGKDRVVFEKDI
jgi:GNAT superfamily N-acetyltransferase